MTVCVVGSIIRKPEHDTITLSMDWSGLLDLGIGRTLPTMDRIESSSWAIASDSPSATVTLPVSDFDAATATAWVSIAGGNSGDTVFLDNTITTTGAAVNGKNTPPQTLVRRMRVKIEGC